MHPTEPEPTPPTSPRPKPTGWIRLWYAARHSLDGLRAGWREPAFRQEALAAALLLPAAFWLGRTWVEIALLVGVVLLVMVVELLNTAVESVVDRVGPQWHALSKRAKDLGSAAVLLALLLCVGVWSAALWSRLGH
ncbi:diacylglycerol kinase [Tepidimonas charontis]|nr:diacylglycerol kinase [Tepidimonas charontis]